MAPPAFFQKFGRDFVYLSIIGCLLGWIWMDGKRDEAWNETVNKNILISNNILDYSGEGEFRQIEKSSIEYFDEIKGHDILRRAEVVRNCTSTYCKNIESILNVIWTENFKKPFPLKRSLSKEELQRIRLKSSALYDSIMVYTDKDKRLSAEISTVLGQDSITTIWAVGSNLSTSQTLAYLNGLILNAKAAARSALNYLDSALEPPTDCSPWIPIAVSSKNVLLPGETFHADIYLGRYSASKMVRQNVTVKVNGKTFPIIDGLAHFAQRYNNPGEQTYKVDIEVVNPLTKQVTSLKKDFSLLVVDSCR